METDNIKFDSNKNIEEYFNIPLNKINEQLSLEDKNLFAEKVVDYWQKKGFPYFNSEDIDVEKEIKKVISYDCSKIQLENDEIQQVMTGLNVVNMFHPHMWNTKCKNMLTPFEVFSDKELFKKAMLKRIKMSDCTLRPFSIRKAIKIYSGVQSVSNFRPTVAKYIYEKYAGNNSSVLDPCAGYSGRLMGAFTSKNVFSYTGFDPCEETFNGNINAYNEFMKYKFKDFKSEFFKLPFEDSDLKNKFDFIFTSPPYFNIEKYSNEDTQSWIRYNSYDLWRDKFLFVFINKCYNFLNNNKYFVLNVAGEQIIEDSKRIALDCGFELVKTEKMRLSQMPGKGNDKNIKKFKYEPVFVFYKK